MKAPVIVTSKTVAVLARGNGNPRNSEGDFALLKDGAILFAYSRYNGDSDHDDAGCDIAGMISEDGGNSFQPLPELLATARYHGVQNIMSVSLKRLATGELCLFYLLKRGPQSEYWLQRANEDERSFGVPEQCVRAEDGIYYVVNNCRVQLGTDGAVLVPFARHAIQTEPNGERHGVYFGTCQLFAGDKDGRNFTKRSEVISMPHPGYSGTGLQEPGIIRLADGRLYAYFRTDRCFQYESFSSDEGKTWTTPVPSRFTSPDSPLLIAENDFSGKYYAVWNPIPNYNGRMNREKRWISAGRTPLVLAQSENGLDFSDYTVLEDNPTHGYCYPAIFFLSENKLLMSYCCGGPDDGMCLTKTVIRMLEIQ